MSTIFEWIFYKPFSWLLNVFQSFTGNYGLSLLLFALVVRLIMLPFAIKQQKSQIKMAYLRPKLAAIEKKYAGRNDKPTLDKKRQEIYEFQRQAGVSPTSGCLPLIIQLIIIFPLYEIIRKPLTYLARFTSDQIAQIRDLLGQAETAQEFSLVGLIREKLAADPTVFNTVSENFADRIPNFNLFGSFFDLSQNPSFTSILILIPILVGAGQWFSMWITQKMNASATPGTDPAAAASMKMMSIVMPLITVFMSFSFSAAIGLYWFYGSLLTVAQTLILAKVMPVPVISEKEYKKAEREMNVKAERARMEQEARSRKSMHHIDDDDEYPDLPEYVSKYDREDSPAAVDPEKGSSLIDEAPMKQTPPKHDKKKGKH